MKRCFRCRRQTLARNPVTLRCGDCDAGTGPPPPQPDWERFKSGELRHGTVEAFDAGCACTACASTWTTWQVTVVDVAADQDQEVTG